MSHIVLGDIWEVESEPRNPVRIGARKRTLVPTDKKLVVPRSKFGHVHVRGMTGSGKSSVAITLLIAQFMEPY